MISLGFPTTFRNVHSGAFSISGTKFNDPNNNGARDSGESGLPGWRIELLFEGEVIDSIVTSADGTYSFDHLAPKSYTVREVQKPGWIQTYPPSGSHSIMLTTASKTNADFGNHQTDELEVRKIALNSHVKRGEEIEYLIQIKAPLDSTYTNVTVRDVFNRDVEFIEASPMPDSDGIWRIPQVKGIEDWDTLITLRVKVPEKQDFELDMAQGIAGKGFVNIRNDYSTTYQSYVITNCIYVTVDEFPNREFSDCTSVTVSDPGTELSTREHGSGTYESAELVTVRTENKSILMHKDMAATYAPTTIGLYHGREVTFSSRWTQAANAKNRVTGTSMSEEYRYATFIDRESRMFLDQNESVMEIDVEFDGMGHIGFLKMPTNRSTPQDTPIIEVREDYIGSFKILQRVDEYGKGVSYEKAASGSGFTVGDRRIGESQRSYESGTGTYDSEELIETYTNYIAKDISSVHAPMSQQLTDDRTIAYSQKWREGMHSTTPRTSYIGEEYTSLSYLDKETVARGLNEMLTDATFEGIARYRVLLERNQSEPEIDFDEQYIGDYSIERRVHLTGVAKYDRPHLNVTKTLNRVYVETLPRDYGEPHIEGAVKTRRVADYTIRIENEGNRVLQPVYVRDYFPLGSSLIEPSSLRPTEITDTSANWTLTHLSIGGVVEIDLSLDVSKYHSAGYPPELVNRVNVCAGLNGEWVCASNYSALEIKWLTCCLDDGTISVIKGAEIDPANPKVVNYRIDITNNDDSTRVATVTDWLPAGMTFLESSTPIASYEDGVIVWNILDICAFETKTIEFSALAVADGRFMNTVKVDPRSVDGPIVQPVYATCVIDVGVVGGECDPISCGIWQHPNWDLEHVGYPAGLTCDDICSLSL
ncbi:SdrD B-like domain-containing protein [Methanotrichaceae archaeon M04Ac]|uniref:SdrD B-like domain-containing protein n=1 Tax=Candidatus Methanocrinis alkalitolerans TaxID=3033395 RepID=A0ABT5XHJ1_9EURY|nr:SdrD B-like domain-containing protein [Candidatus Methanocrinis alkalitolerans]MDF0594185.1 SdrD B-like domain-containing protein [Candidatus Methanocrinis alkalitolerans]